MKHLRSRRLIGAALATILLGLVAGAPAEAKKAKRYGIEGKFISYDQASQTFTVLVLSRSAPGFGGSTVGGKAPKDVGVREERAFAVKPEGSVLSRTVIKSSKGTGLDNSGTQDGFTRAVAAIPTDRALAFSIERNAAHEKDESAPAYRIKTVVIKLTDAEIMRRLNELFEDDDEETP